MLQLPKAEMPVLRYGIFLLLVQRIMCLTATSRCCHETLFGFFQDVADPRWTSQLVRPQDVPLLETSWELCDARLMNEESKQRFQMASSPIGRLDNIRIPDLRGKTSVAAAAALKRPSDK